MDFVDILKPRNTQFGIINFMTKPWEPKKTMSLDVKCDPRLLKKIVLSSTYIDSFIDAESRKVGIPKQQLKNEVINYLDEIAMDKKLHIIRWMGIVFLKISFMMKIGMFVNEPAVLKLKESLGKNPVLFLPTHRSYADFCLLTYLCFHYDIELPAVAAGMDFYSMAVVGKSMRETGAFYMRRTLVGAPLYAATLRHYVRTLVAKHNAPVEFFLEGTRSRSNKSMAPKYGMLSMCLLPYFAREVMDMTIVPINISYDRLVEQSLFAYEHLGVPKPKETTGGLLKSLGKLNDNFGNIYVQFGETISLNAYLGDQGLTPASLLPLDLLTLAADQKKKVQKVAEYAVSLQQSNTVVTITNLLAIVLMDSLIKNEALTLDDAFREVEGLIDMLRSLGARVYETDVRRSVHRILVVHRSLMAVQGNKLRLIAGDPMTFSPEVRKKMKGHSLGSETIVSAVPVIQLQLYVNPVLHYLVPPALLYLLASRGPAHAENIIYNEYKEIRALLRYEFFYVKEQEEIEFEAAQEYCTRNGLLHESAGVHAGTDARAGVCAGALCWVALPALCTLQIAAQLLSEQRVWPHKEALRLVQARAEASRAHPYCLSLEAAANCLRGLLDVGVLTQTDSQEETYEVHPTKLQETLDLVNSVIPKLSLDFGANNSVIVSHKTVSSKL
ncbi:dihydroxyacetone phosphate acyltransferase isoform X2 [Aricia agestis]|nr:dihydroxyacetone phosphate acyltransferase isoform X2 [Aricia agestis]